MNLLLPVLLLLTAPLAEGPAPGPAAGEVPATAPPAELVADWEQPLDGAVRSLAAVRLAGRDHLLLGLDTGIELRLAADGATVWRRSDLAPGGMQTVPPALGVGGPMIGWAGNGGAGGPRLEMISLADGTTVRTVSLEEPPLGPPLPLVDSAGGPVRWYLPLANNVVAVIGAPDEAYRRRLVGGDLVGPLLAPAGQPVALTGPEPALVPLGTGRRLRSVGRLLPQTLMAHSSWVYGSGERKLSAYRCRVTRRGSLSCRRRWRQRLGAAALAPPTVVGDRVLVPSLDTFLYAFKRENGHLLWRSRVGHRLAAPPRVHGDIVAVVAQETPQVILLDLTEGTRITAIGGERGELFPIGAALAGSRLVVPVVKMPGERWVLRSWPLTPLAADRADRPGRTKP